MHFGLSVAAKRGFRYDHLNDWKWWEVDEPRSSGNRRINKFLQSMQNDEEGETPNQPAPAPEPPVHTD